MGLGTYAGAASRAVGESPYGATKRVSGVPTWPHGPGDACGRCHWGLRWNYMWGHETCEGAELEPSNARR
eukprot:4423022-Pyramimonas_sp.AAC.1